MSRPARPRRLGRPRPRPGARGNAAPLRCAPDISPVVEQLRTLIREVVPGVEERVYKGETSAGYHDPQAGCFCGFFSAPGVVWIEFPHGVVLSPPEAILRKGRYVQFHPGDRIPRKALARILHGALVASM